MLTFAKFVTSVLLAIAAIGIGGVLLGGLAILMQFMRKREIAWLVGGALFVVCLASAIYTAVFV